MYINKQHKSPAPRGQHLRSIAQNNFPIYVATLLFSFAVSLITSSLAIPTQSSQATTGLTLVTQPTLTLATSVANLNLSPLPNQNPTSTSHSLTVNTNVPNGYNLSLSATTIPALPTTKGTITSPIALADNTWGYALASTSVVGVLNDFDASYASPAPSPDSKWANPNIPTTIKNTAASTSGDQTTVYYGAKAGITLPTGTYESTVRYTATTNATVYPSPTIISVTPSTGPITGGTRITVVGTGFTLNNQSITLSVNLGLTNGRDEYMSCSNVSIFSDTPVVGQDTLYCDTPAYGYELKSNLYIGTYGGNTVGTGMFTFIEPAEVTFVSPSIASTIPGTESGPAITIVGASFSTHENHQVTDVTIGGTSCVSFEVISTTQIFCKAPNTIAIAGDKAVQVHKAEIPSTGTANITYTNTAYPTFTDTDAFTTCSTTPQLFRDTRDSQLYYVKKMPDDKCWMVDNLKYANFGTLSQENGKYLTVDGTNTQSTTTNGDVAKYVDPGATTYCAGNIDIPTSTNTRCGLLYNYYAATNGKGTYAIKTEGTNISGNICPANFRLPSGRSDGLTAVGNGTLHGAADLAVLNASMNSGTLTTPGSVDPSYYAGWQPSGIWNGVFSGGWQAGLLRQGNAGDFWQSTVSSSAIAGTYYFSSNFVGPGNYQNEKSYGHAIRCLMDQPQPIDVYPTTGWVTDTITITGRGFTNITSITVGGYSCLYGTGTKIHSSSKITCALPPRPAGISHDIEIIANGINVTPTSTYTHMKVTYFNPSASTVSVGGTTYPFYPNGFTTTNCSTMTPNNGPIAQTPANSMAYIRDTRNNQTYRVKKMPDNKCWMVDNLKYISTTSPSNIDGTVGMTYNQGDHLGNGGSGAYNTVNETSTQSTTNSDKAFYNNPMSSAACYGGSTSYMSANTLTHCGYLYNWYAATNGTGTYAQSTEGTNVTGNICPANFRLPSGASDGSTATGNGTSYNAADLAVLSASMKAGNLSSGSTSKSYHAGWQPAGVWGGTFSGDWSNGLGGQGDYGYFWSSTVNSADSARNLYFHDGYVLPGSSASTKRYGFTVRCVLP